MSHPLVRLELYRYGELYICLKSMSACTPCGIYGKLGERIYNPTADLGLDLMLYNITHNWYRYKCKSVCECLYFFFSEYYVR